MKIQVRDTRTGEIVYDPSWLFNDELHVLAPAGWSEDGPYPMEVQPHLRAEIVQMWTSVYEEMPEAGRYVKVRNEFRDEMVMKWCSDPDGQQCWETRDGRTAIPSFVAEWRPLTSEEVK